MPLLVKMTTHAALRPAPNPRRGRTRADQRQRHGDGDDPVAGEPDGGGAEVGYVRKGGDTKLAKAMSKNRMTMTENSLTERIFLQMLWLF
jgi:hypothetical protein